MGYWLKLIYNTPERMRATDWPSLTWVSDHHRRRQDGTVTHRPTYAVGDEILIYDVHAKLCPARFRVSAEPEFDPARVNAEGKAGDGDRWGWLTELEVLGAVDADRAPTPNELGIEPMSLRQLDHKKLTPEQFAAARRFVPTGVRGGRRRPARPVPIEQSTVEDFEIRFEARIKAAHRKEQQLVRAYADYLEVRGRTVERFLCQPDGGGPALYSDLFERDRRNLVEAKSGVTRPAIRMAIGQLADYARFIRPAPKRRAVLVPERPPQDLEALLKAENIAVVWREGKKFADNADGELL